MFRAPVVVICANVIEVCTPGGVYVLVFFVTFHVCTGYFKRENLEKGWVGLERDRCQRRGLKAEGMQRGENEGIRER